MLTKKLMVENLDYSITRDEVKKLFSQYGKVTDVKSVGIRGLAFVEMSKKKEAKKAQEALHGSRFKGSKLEVNSVSPT